MRPPLLAALCLAAAGCGAEDKLYDVSGTVTFAGKPVPAGVVYFDPDGSKGTAGTQGHATIENGRYDTKATGQGVRGGWYVVRVVGYDGVPSGELPLGQPLFLEYTERKELPAAPGTLDVTVPGAGRRK